MAQRSFTPEQQRVIEHHHGHAIVSAVAGSGKTETIVGRLARLVRVTEPARIAVVMFNTSAAQQFQERFRDRVGSAPPQIRTFNAMGERITRVFMSNGHLPPLTLVTSENKRAAMAQRALTQAFAALHGSSERPDASLKADFLAYIGLVKADILAPQDTFAAGNYSSAATCFPHAYELYETARLDARTRFYEDQVYAPVMAMRKHANLKAMVADKLDHLIVDEAQDVNGIQIELMRILAGSRASVMVVGDEDQCIYHWRGAQPEFLPRTFQTIFHNPARYTLTRTFRFGHALALAANHLIANNTRRVPKQSIALPNASTRIHTHAASTQGALVGKLVANAKARSYSDVAVLVRTYDTAIAVEIDLLARGIPYFVYGRAPLLRVQEISALMAALQLAAGWSAESSEEDRIQSVRDLLLTPTLYLHANVVDELATKITAAPREVGRILSSAVTCNMASYQAQQIRDRADSLDIIANHTPPTMTAANLIAQYLATTQFEQAIKRQAATPEKATEIIANVIAFSMLASEHGGSAQAFIDSLGALADCREGKAPTHPHVWISSIHRAKGAEWDTVIVPGLANKVFPRQACNVDIEAERRLAYVAMTRARRVLHLIHPADESYATACADLSAPTSAPDSAVSSFVWEARVALSTRVAQIVADGDVSPGAIQEPDIANAYLAALGRSERFTSGSPPLPAREATPKDAKSLRAGRRIKVVTFGAGTVQGWTDDRIVRVLFDSGDSRQFVAALMPFTTLP